MRRRKPRLLNDGSAKPSIPVRSPTNPASNHDSRSMRGPHMSDDTRDSGPEAGAKGIVEEVKGKVKEAAGALTGDKDLKKEGAAQQDKADSQREVAAEGSRSRQGTRRGRGARSGAAQSSGLAPREGGGDGRVGIRRFRARPRALRRRPRGHRAHPTPRAVPRRRHPGRRRRAGRAMRSSAYCPATKPRTSSYIRSPVPTSSARTAPPPEPLRRQPPRQASARSCTSAGSATRATTSPITSAAGARSSRSCWETRRPPHCGPASSSATAASAGRSCDSWSSVCR